MTRLAWTSIISISAVGLAACCFAFTHRAQAPSDVQTVTLDTHNISHFASKEQEAAGLCPWRNQLTELHQFFPTADRAIEWNLVVSAQRQQVAKRLGRQPTGDENALRCYAVMNGKNALGYVVARRVRGEYGLIEIVIAVDASTEKIRNVEIQRLREPQPIARILQSQAWIDKFKGLGADANWSQVNSAVPATASTDAKAITEAARTAMILLSTATASAGPIRPK